ncbi:hypothetical protein MNBD_GAMMA26-869 [hydrothermal vent metagenome]|uniref:Sulfatase-modifying factor enzyme-like domain-containing protein n=1 Tax=hydrothermal vent metagenome TaxID=652676 RepID=A0A3B1C2Z7_9ZZZZ
MNQWRVNLRIMAFDSAWFCMLCVILSIAVSTPGMASQLDQKSRNKAEMVLIPGGGFIMGSSKEELKPIIEEFGKRADFYGYDFDSEVPQRKIYLKDYYIDRYEVTNAQYKEFIDATGHLPPRHWTGGSYAGGRGNNAVIKISWFDASAYAIWAGKRLPTEEEWEKAARGPDGRAYPWGPKFDPAKAGTAETILFVNFPITGLTNFAAPVDAFTEDKSPYGVMGMTGNVMEWTESWYTNDVLLVVKGGAWVHLGVRARGAARIGIGPESISHILGFRCAMDAD